jgi:hypothetical protein
MNLHSSTASRFLAGFASFLLIAVFVDQQPVLAQRVPIPNVPKRPDPATTDWLRQQLREIDKLLADVADVETRKRLLGQLLNAQAMTGDVEGLDANLARFPDVDTGTRMKLSGELAMGLARDGNFDEAYRIADRINGFDSGECYDTRDCFQRARDSILELQVAHLPWQQAAEIAIKEFSTGPGDRRSGFRDGHTGLRCFCAILVRAAECGHVDEAIQVVKANTLEGISLDRLLGLFLAGDSGCRLPTETKISVLKKFHETKHAVKALYYVVSGCETFEDWRRICDFSISRFGPDVLPMIVPAGETRSELFRQESSENMRRSFPDMPVDVPAPDKREGAFAKKAVAHLRFRFPDLRERALANKSLALVMAKLYLLAGEFGEADLLFYQQNAGDFQKQVIPFLASRCVSFVCERNAEQLHKCFDLVSQHDMRLQLVFSTEHALQRQNLQDGAKWLMQQAASRLVPVNEFDLNNIVRHLLAADCRHAARTLAHEWLNSSQRPSPQVNQLFETLALDCISRNERLEALTYLDQFAGPNRYYYSASLLAACDNMGMAAEMLKQHAGLMEQVDPGRAFGEPLIHDAPRAVIADLFVASGADTAFAFDDHYLATTGKPALNHDAVAEIAERLSAGKNHRAQLGKIQELAKRFPEQARLHYWAGVEYCRLVDFDNMVAELTQFPEITPDLWLEFLACFISSLPTQHNKMVPIAKRHLAGRSDLIGELSGRMAQRYVENNMHKQAIRLFDDFEQPEARSAVIYQLAIGNNR